jgi:hypothetical protein
MAASKNDIVEMVTQFTTANTRPCPKKEVIAKHGEDAAALLKSLVEVGILSVRRGRNGGYSIADASATVAENNEEQTVESPVDDVDLADQFAALEAKLAAAEAAENAGSIETEQVPF